MVIRETYMNMENGRAKIYKEYLEKLMMMLEFIKEDFKCFVEGKFKDSVIFIKTTIIILNCVY